MLDVLRSNYQILAVITLVLIILAVKVFGLVLTALTYMDNRYCPQQKFSFTELVKVLFYGILDAFFFRPYIGFVNFTAFFKYKKITKSKWVSPKRVTVESD